MIFLHSVDLENLCLFEKRYYPVLIGCQSWPKTNAFGAFVQSHDFLHEPYANQPALTFSSKLSFMVL